VGDVSDSEEASHVGAGGQTPRVRLNPDVVWRRLDDEVVIIHLSTNRIYALNATGAALWETLAAGSAPAEVESRLRKEFEVEPTQITGEVDGLLGELIAEGLVSVD
jgi:hypothetical protein